VIRKKYSNPPLHGALVAQTILNDKKLFESWRSELRDIVAKRIIEMRKALRG
jgi:aspartate/tyrosine/aromatic aminotransferase